MSSKSRISAFKDICASAFNRFVLAPVKAVMSRVTGLFGTPGKKKEETESKWTRKVDLDFRPLLPTGPRPVGPLPGDVHGARAAIPKDFMSVVIAGHRAYLPPRDFYENMSSKQAFASASTATRARQAANDRVIAAMPVLKIA